MVSKRRAVAVVVLVAAALEGQSGGRVVGTLMLLLSSASFDVVNLVVGLTYAVTMPLVTIITTYLYFHLVTEEALSPAQPKRALVLPAEV